MLFQSPLLHSVFATVLLLLFAPGQGRAEQIITPLVMSNETLGYGLSAPSINGNGVVAYIDSGQATL